jgi:hypothetical protein
MPDAALPKTVEEQIALLVQREPAPDAAVAELARRRMAAVYEDLATARSIPAARLVASPVAAGTAPAPTANGQGRVEFSILADGK